MDDTYKKKVVAIAKAYSRNKPAKFFANDEAFTRYNGYKIVRNNHTNYLCFTNQWTLVSIPLTDDECMEIKHLMNANAITESHVEEQNVLKVLNNTEIESEWIGLENLISATISANHWVRVPTGDYFSVIGIKPSIPFLDESQIKMKKVTDLQSVITVPDFTLSIAPMTHLSDVSLKEAIEVKRKNVEEETESFGLFF